MNNRSELMRLSQIISPYPYCSNSQQHTLTGNCPPVAASDTTSGNSTYTQESLWAAEDRKVADVCMQYLRADDVNIQYIADNVGICSRSLLSVQRSIYSKFKQSGYVYFTDAGELKQLNIYERAFLRAQLAFSCILFRDLHKLYISKELEQVAYRKKLYEQHTSYGILNGNIVDQFDVSRDLSKYKIQLTDYYNLQGKRYMLPGMLVSIDHEFITTGKVSVSITYVPGVSTPQEMLRQILKMNFAKYKEEI